MNSRSNNFELILEWHDTKNNKFIKKEDIDKYLKEEDYINFYAYILHDKDVDNDTGEVLRKHWHLVIRTSCLLSKKTIINDIAKYFLINTACISCHCSYDICKSVRYLTHEYEDKEKRKHVYSRYEVYCSNGDIFCNIMDYNSCEYAITIEYLTTLCMKCHSLLEVYRHLSVQDARAYRNVIIDIMKIVKHESGELIEKYKL